MKKHISILFILSIVLSLILSLALYANDLDPRNLTTEEVEKERDSHPSNMNSKQKDLLRAYGVTEDELKTITRREIGDILLFGNMVKPEYIEPYMISKQEMKESSDKTEKALQEQRLRFEQNGLSLEDLDFMSENYLFEEIAKMPISTIKKIIQDAKSSLETESGDFSLQYITPNLYTRFNKDDIGAYETTTYLYFQRYSMDTSYASIATSAHNIEVSNYVNNAYTIGRHLFSNQGGQIILTKQQYAGNLFGELTEGSSSSTNKVHEGIDYIRSEGVFAHLKCPIADGIACP